MYWVVIVSWYDLGKAGGSIWAPETSYRNRFRQVCEWKPNSCYMWYICTNEWFWSAMIPICELWIFEKWYELPHMSILTLWIIDIELYMMKHVRSLISKWYVIDAWKLYKSHMI